MSAQPQPTRTYDFAGGQPAVADAVDTDLNTLYTVLQAGIGNTHIASDAQISLSKLSTTDTWTSFTPTWTGNSSNPAIGNGTITGRYLKIGRTYWVWYFIQVGSTSTLGSGYYSLGTPNSSTAVNATIAFEGVGYIGDASAGAEFPIWGHLGGNSTSIQLNYAHTGTLANTVDRQSVTPTVPFTFATSDTITFGISYEAQA